MNRSLGLWLTIVAMNLPGQVLPAANPKESRGIKDLPDYERMLRAETDFNTRIANQILGLAARKDLKKLSSLAHSGRTNNERLFAGYILYRLKPNAFRASFEATFPVCDSDIGAFLDCGSALPYNKERETNCVVRPGVTWAISFWDIEAAMLECVKVGEPEAVVRFYCLQGSGDGEIGEGLASDFMDLYVEHPDLVVKFWSVFRNSIDYLRGIDAWYDAETKERTKSRYRDLLAPEDPRLKSILAEIDLPD
ncbi:MAG TPA: hypothetical protein VFT46_06090 [Holophagaceae bacterium]|nr:hypothetical protein [Holophagaceae bacterium]